VIDARALGISPDEAILRARAGTLPKGPRWMKERDVALVGSDARPT